MTYSDTDGNPIPVNRAHPDTFYVDPVIHEITPELQAMIDYINSLAPTHANVDNAEEVIIDYLPVPLRDAYLDLMARTTKAYNESNTVH